MASGPVVARIAPCTGRRDQLRHVLDLPAVPPAAALACRDATEAVTEQVAQRIAAEVDAFGSMRDPRRARLLRTTVSTAVRVFVDALSGAPTTGSDVFDLYRRIGRSHARAGLSLDAMRAAHHIASQETWDELREVGGRLGLDSTRLLRLADGLRAYQGALLDQAIAGFDAMHTPEHEARQAWRDLVKALTCDVGDVDLAALAARCSWKLPERVVVLATDQLGDDLDVDHGVVLAACNRRSFVVAPAELAEATTAAVLTQATGPVAISWEVSVADSFRATRWASRTLDLVDDLVIEVPAGGLVRCCEHQTTLSLHADPVLRRHADREVLAPLIDEKGKRRAALAETLMVWLQARRPSAPALAEMLGVHEQTVRHRMRYLNTMFDEPLHDPTATLGLLTALESVTPGWLRSAG